MKKKKSEKPEKKHIAIDQKVLFFVCFNSEILPPHPHQVASPGGSQWVLGVSMPDLGLSCVRVLGLCAAKSYTTPQRP